jgi:hypothetical protein
MRAPPPVEFSSTPGGGWRAALSLLVGASVAVPVAWLLPYVAASGSDPDVGALPGRLGDAVMQATLALGLAAAVVAVFWRAWPRLSGGSRTLRWDGQDWVLVQAGAPERRGDATLMLDLGRWMLVRFRPADAAGGRAPAWLPLTATADAARWAALRGALWNWRSHEAAR